MEQALEELHLRQHMMREDFEVFHFRGNNGFQIAPHFHDFYECSLLLSGQLSYQIESVSFAEEPGDLLLIGPNHVHRPLFIHENKPYERIVFWLSRMFVEKLSDENCDLSACFSGTHNSAIRLSGAAREQITRVLFELLQASEGEPFGREVLTRALSASLLVYLNRISRGEGVAPPQMEIRVSPLVKRVSDYLEEHLSEPITLDELCRTVYLSKYYLERKFRQETGASIYQMLQKKRMIRARNQMQKGLSLTQIALNCGFSEYSGFYKAFRSEYGMSPHDYLVRLKETESSPL
ncbi:MAG: AraC family transcriptional regulator [Eubacteriales bacterium]|nr:AraC family transcriptional regulator [Eubacteriales bacterium]